MHHDHCILRVGTKDQLLPEKTDNTVHHNYSNSVWKQTESRRSSTIETTSCTTEHFGQVSLWCFWSRANPFQVQPWSYRDAFPPITRNSQSHSDGSQIRWVNETRTGVYRTYVTSSAIKSDQLVTSKRLIRAGNTACFTSMVFVVFEFLQDAQLMMSRRCQQKREYECINIATIGWAHVGHLTY